MQNISDVDNIFSSNHCFILHSSSVYKCFFFNPRYLFVSGRFVAVDAAMNEDQDGEIGADAGPQRAITGVLLSPSLEQGEWSCLRLVYQIIGSGSLEVLQRTEGKSFDRPLWSSQEPSDSWVISSMDLQNNTEPYRVKHLKLFSFIFV